MKTEEIFIFKGIEKRDAFEFTNEKGALIKCPACYKVKFDEQKKGVIYNRELKIKATNENSDLIKRLQDVKLYSSLLMEFEVVLYQTQVMLNLLDFSVVDENGIVE